MGRLFWKLFLLIGIPQLAGVFLLGLYFSLHFHDRDRFEPRPRDFPPPAPFERPGTSPGYPPNGMGPPRPGMGPGGPGPGGPGGPPQNHSPFVPPPEAIVGGLLASIVSSALLAWFLSRPIRSLRRAFVAAAGGDLKVRVAPSLGPGRDELHDLGREFDRMVERLEALINGQRRLLHDVSHELRSPLARMQAAIGLANQQPDQGRAAMERIERESLRMDRLIGELLALARLQAGFTGAMNEEIELRELVGVIADDARFEAHSKGRTVEVDNETEVLVRGNVELLRRAIENVVRNAIKYSFEGGAVRIATRRAGDPARIVISVSDNGPGVPEPDLADIFQPFFRSLGSGGQEGHGLGLAIARRVVEAHGGTITASNIERGGLRVDMELPVLQA